MCSFTHSSYWCLRCRSSKKSMLDARGGDNTQTGEIWIPRISLKFQGCRRSFPTQTKARMTGSNRDRALRC